MRNSELKSIYDRTLSFWPKKIIISKKTLYDNGGADIPDLVEIHDKVVTEILSNDNENRELEHMDWALYTVVHEMAKTIKVVDFDKVDTEKVFKIYKKNRQ